MATLIYAIIKDKRQNKSALNRAVGFLLLNRLSEWCMDCIDRGEISRKQLQIIENGYSLYHELGGNGFADALVNQCRRLPLKGEKNEK